VPTDTAHEKQQVHQLIDRLAPSQVAAVRGFLEAIINPVVRSLPSVLLDDEPFTDAERQAVSEADEWLKHNQPIQHEELLAELGLTTADWEKMADALLLAPVDEDEITVETAAALDHARA
jgi:hypothetical protein